MIAPFADPITGSEFEEGGAIQSPRGTTFNVLDLGIVTEVGGSDGSRSAFDGVASACSRVRVSEACSSALKPLAMPSKPSS
jgi:hypothetical protein